MAGLGLASSADALPFLQLVLAAQMRIALSILLIVLLSSVWVFFWGRARALARLIDRYEVVVLKPLSITCAILSLIYLVRAAWLAGGVFAALWVVCGGFGAALHRRDTVAQLTAGTIGRMARGPRQGFAPEESYDMAKASLGASFVVAVGCATIVLRHGFSTLFSIVLAGIVGWIFALLSSFIVIFQRRSRPGT